MSTEIWNFADLYEAAAAIRGDAEFIVHGDSRRGWREFGEETNGLAATLLAHGLGRQAKVGAYLYSTPEHAATYFAAFKAALVPFNVNYRYKPEEVHYLIDNADAEAVVFGSTYTESVDAIRGRLPRVKLWLWVDDGGGDTCPDWALDYRVAAAPQEELRVPWGRSPDDLVFLYTGGTTGMPKAVMWRQDDIVRLLGAGGSQLRGIPPCESMAEYRERVAAAEQELVNVPACPLMHGTGISAVYSTLLMGGKLVLMRPMSFDPAELLDVTESERVTGWSIVGDPFARPIVEALDASPGRWDLSSLLTVTSSGAMWSEPVKRALLRHAPRVILVDALMSSEAGGMGISVTTAEDAVATGRFVASPRLQVLRDDGTPLEPGSPEVGIAAVGPPLPLGYFKDPEKTAQTIRSFGDRRYVFSGDMATVEPDGSIVLLGRGSACITTGGEKVYPEEVEEVLKEYPGVRDAVCVGVPDERWGEAVTAIVDSATDLDEAALVAFAKTRLADYKAPKHVLRRSIPRSATGKLDYREVRDWADQQITMTRVRR